MPERLVMRPRPKCSKQPGWRWWLIRHTPTVLIDYLLEVLLTAAAVITSAAYLTGISARGAAIRLLPPWLAELYAITILCGAVAVTIGLALRRHGTVVAYGMRVLAIGCTVYAISAAHYLGLAVLPTIVMSSVLAILAAWRAFLLHSTYLYLRDERPRRTGKSAP